MPSYFSMSLRPVIWRWIATCLCAWAGLAAIAADSPAPVLTNAAQVRALSSSAASSGQAVRLRGVVLLEVSWAGDSIVLADETAAIYLDAAWPTFSGYQMGDLLEVIGVSDPGKFAPIVKVSSIQKIGSGTIPNPLPVAFPELQSGRLDAQWVEVGGVVRRSESVPGDSTAWGLWLAVGGGSCVVRSRASRRTRSAASTA